jgi:hypothetical protein
MINFINLTPHTLNIHSGGNVTDIPPSGTIARVQTSYEHVDTLGGIDIFDCVYGAIEGLPAPQTGNVFIVSGVVKSATSREDLMSPGELIRDENGKPAGSKGLRR